MPVEEFAMAGREKEKSYQNTCHILDERLPYRPSKMQQEIQKACTLTFNPLADCCNQSEENEFSRLEEKQRPSSKELANALQNRASVWVPASRRSKGHVIYKALCSFLLVFPDISFLLFLLLPEDKLHCGLWEGGKWGRSLGCH